MKAGKEVEGIMTYERACLIVDGMAEAARWDFDTKYYLKQLLNQHGTHTAQNQIRETQRWNRAIRGKAEEKEPYPDVSSTPHPRHNPENYEEWNKRQGKLL